MPTQAQESPRKLHRRGLLALTLHRRRQTRTRRLLNRDNLDLSQAIFMRAVDEISVWSLAANHRMTGEMKVYTLRNGRRCGSDGKFAKKSSPSCELRAETLSN